jgi:hypothetical protein
MGQLRIVIIESPNPIDIFEGRAEAPALAKMCELIGHKPINFFAKSANEFDDIIKYLASANSVHADEVDPLTMLLHISCHGNGECVAIGKDILSWQNLVDRLNPLITNNLYHGNLAITVSACGSGKNRISRSLIKSDSITLSGNYPNFIFGVDSENVTWDDSLMAWSILYYKIAKMASMSRDNVQIAMKDVFRTTNVCLKYNRWDDNNKKYYQWSAANSLTSQTSDE